MTIAQSVSNKIPGEKLLAGQPLSLENMPPLRSEIVRMQSRSSNAPETWRLKNFSASQDYEVALDEKPLEAHRANQQRIAQIIAKRREAFFLKNPNASAADFRKEVESSLETVLKDAGFDAAPYISKAGQPDDPGFIHGYGKYLLYGDDNVDAPYCLQYFHFSPGQKTPIHDHPIPCISLVVRGQLLERRYSPTSNSEARKIAALPRPYLDKQSFLDISLPNIHSLKNKHSEFAGSVHFYYIDGAIMSRAVKTVYQQSKHEQEIVS